MQASYGGPLLPIDPARDSLSDEERALILAYRQGWLPPPSPAPPPARGGAVRLLLGGIAGLFGLLLVVILLVTLLTLVNFVTATNQAVNGVGERAAQAMAGTGQAIGGLLQGLADRADPSHPPRGPLALDAEFEALRLLRPGEVLGETGEYVLRVEAIRRRDGAASPDTGQYVVVKRQYRVPRETKVLGLTVRVDDGAAEHYLDKGESFRIGRMVYKVNWVSRERGQVAIAQYRLPDQVTAPLEFAYD